MKPKRITKPNNPKILEQESEKLKEKLEMLKQQIQNKKKEKQMNKTTQNNGNNKFLESKQLYMNQTQYKGPQNNILVEILSSMKMEMIIPKLKEKGINEIDQLMNTKQEEIDKWKDIAVGYRIKLKKIMQKHRFQLSQMTKNASKQGSPSTALEQQKNIEDIIKERKEEKHFIALNRQIEEEQVDEYQQKELNEDEQEILIQSLMNAFKPGKSLNSILKSPSKNNLESSTDKKSVHWSLEVDKMEKVKSDHKQYPKEVTPKILLQNPPLEEEEQKQHSYNVDLKYCWSCLKLIKKQSDSINHDGREFCSNLCEDEYKSGMLEDSTDLFQQIEKTQELYAQLKKNATNSMQVKQQRIDDVEIIDFSIE